jgi:DNA-directed RNA polymerase specialized sigma24 family protein
MLRKNEVKSGRARRRNRSTVRRVYETLSAFAKTRERLAQLPDQQRLPLTLVMIDGLSYTDAASRLDIPVVVLMDRLADARASLQQMIASSGVAHAAE